VKRNGTARAPHTRVRNGRITGAGGASEQSRAGMASSCSGSWGSRNHIDDILQERGEMKGGAHEGEATRGVGRLEGRVNLPATALAF
jgi:hypothetical protein